MGGHTTIRKREIVINSFIKGKTQREIASIVNRNYATIDLLLNVSKWKIV